MADQIHPFDSFYAAFGLDRRATPKFQLIVPSVAEDATVKVEVIATRGLPECLMLTCLYNMKRGLPGDGGPPYDLVGFDAWPQADGSILLSVMDTPYVHREHAWADVGKHIPGLYRWAQALVRQVGGGARTQFVLKPMAEAA